MFKTVGKYSACLLIGAGIGFGLHWHYSGIYDLKQELKAERAKSKLKDGQHDITDRVVTEYIDRIVYVKGKTNEIVKEVPVYIPADIMLPGGFRLLHDAAVRGELSAAASLADARPVDAQTVARTIVENYGTCHEVREQLISLQEWVREQKDVSP